MTLTTGFIICGLILALSIFVNVVFYWYIKNALATIFIASEETSDIFTRLDVYGEHLQTVYDTPTFYGDETLQSLLNHSKEMIEFIKKYENVYSFTQPDLEEQLRSATVDLENYEEEAGETQE